MTETGERLPELPKSPLSGLMHNSLYWGPRVESVEACASRLARFLTLLQPVHPAIANFKSQYASSDSNVPTEPLFPVPDGGGAYVPMFHRLLRETRPSARYYSEGFSFSANSEFGTDRFLSLELRAGCGADHLTYGDLPPELGKNGVGFSTVVKDIAGEDAPILASLKSVLLAGIEAWEPDCGALYANGFRKLKHLRFAPFSDGTWAIYLAPRLAAQISPPTDVLIERVGGDGLLMMATDGYFTHEDPELRAKAEAIHRAVAPIGL